MDIYSGEHLKDPPSYRITSDAGVMEIHCSRDTSNTIHDILAYVMKNSQNIMTFSFRGILSVASIH